MEAHFLQLHYRVNLFRMDGLLYNNNKRKNNKMLMYPPNAIPFNYSFYNFIIERIKTIRKSNAIKSKPKAIKVV